MSMRSSTTHVASVAKLDRLLHVVTLLAVTAAAAIGILWVSSWLRPVSSIDLVIEASGDPFPEMALQSLRRAWMVDEGYFRLDVLRVRFAADSPELQFQADLAAKPSMLGELDRQWFLDSPLSRWSGVRKWSLLGIEYRSANFRPNGGYSLKAPLHVVSIVFAAIAAAGITLSRSNAARRRRQAGFPVQVTEEGA
jgi:hypothetical protein